MGKGRVTRGEGWELVPARRATAQPGPSRARSEPPAGQRVVVREERRAGDKVVTVARGFRLTDGDLKALARRLKQTCGAGGTAEEDTIEVQGRQRDKVVAALAALGYDAIAG